MKSTKIKIGVDTVDGFFARARSGSKVAPEIVISFEDPADMLRVLSA